MKWLTALAVGAVMTAPALTAQAFSVDGHRVIEAAAYRALADAIDGEAVLASLIRDGVLNEPLCFEGDGAISKDCIRARHTDPLAWWPIPGTDAPDLVLERQFSKVGQCFHFMARFEDEKIRVDDVRLPDHVSNGLMYTAYDRCMRQLDELLANIVTKDPRLANANTIGAYAFMHAVADSFSRAHTERDYDSWGADNWKDTKPKAPPVHFLRVWQPIVSNPFSGSSRITRHEVPDERDDNFVDRNMVFGGKHCESYVEHPYSVPERCLSMEGYYARNALRDSLRLFFNLRKQWAKNTALKWEQLDKSEWDTFKARYLDTHFPHEPSKLTDDEERKPTWQFGLAGVYRSRDRGWFTGGQLRLPLRAVSAKGILAYTTVELGAFLRKGEIKEWPYARAELELAVPLGDYISIGAVPISAMVKFDALPSSWRTEVEVSTRLMRVDYMPGGQRTFMVSAYGPLQYVWHGDQRVNPTVGFALTYMSSSTLIVPDGKGPDPDKRRDTYWYPPDPWDVELRRPNGKGAFGVGAGMSAMRRDGVGTWYRGQLDYALSRTNGWGKLNPWHFAFGARVEGRSGQVGELFLAPYVSFSLYTLGSLALPIITVGPTWDLQNGRAALLMASAGVGLTLGHLDLVFDGPRVDVGWVGEGPKKPLYFWDNREIGTFRLMIHF